jgi:hypothetical protein
VSKIENAIPAKERPFADITVQLQNRQTMISEWWQTKQGRLTA